MTLRIEQHIAEQSAMAVFDLTANPGARVLLAALTDVTDKGGLPDEVKKLWSLYREFWTRFGEDLSGLLRDQLMGAGNQRIDWDSLGQPEFVANHVEDAVQAGHLFQTMAWIVDGGRISTATGMSRLTDYFQALHRKFGQALIVDLQSRVQRGELGVITMSQVAPQFVWS
jgi:hypothetical protein